MTTTRQTILVTAKRVFAINGYEGFSMRLLAKECNTGLSSIYHFFKDKDEILKELYAITNREVGEARAKQLTAETANQMMLDRIHFQFEHIEDVVFVLKYYLHFRPEFKKSGEGYLPSKAYLHIEEVLRTGIATGEFEIAEDDIDSEAKVITHAINGFLLEYYPELPDEQEYEGVAKSIHRFLMRSLTNKEVAMS